MTIAWSVRIRRARAKGTCVRCGETYLGSLTACPACLDYTAEWTMDRRARYRAVGCWCGRAAIDGGLQCAYHRARSLIGWQRVTSSPDWIRPSRARRIG